MNKNQSEQGHGCGLATIGDTGALAGFKPVEPSPLAVVEPDNFLASPHAFGDGLFGACAAQFDMRLAQACARKLAFKMAQSGRKDAEQVVGPAFAAVVRDGKGAVLRRVEGWPTQWQDACAAGVVAIQQWRNRAEGSDCFEPVQRVAWRAIAEAISADIFGDGSQFISPGDDWLWIDAQLPPVESRTERAARLLVERAAGRRQQRLQTRFNNIQLAKGANGKRQAESVERVRRACVFLMQGQSLDSAAAAAGFLGSAGHSGKGRFSSGDHLCKAAKRLGVRFQFNQRDVQAERWDGDIDALKVRNAIAEGRGFAGFVPVQLDAHVQAWGDWLSLSQSAHVQAWHHHKTMAPRRDKYSVERSARRGWIAARRAALSPAVVVTSPPVNPASVKRARLHRSLQRRGLRSKLPRSVRYDAHVRVWHRLNRRVRVNARQTLAKFAAWQLARAVRA